VENRMEPDGKQRVHRVSPAAENREIDVLEYGTLERIFARENMWQAYKRVVDNKGSPGVDKMDVYELKQFLQLQWPNVREQLLQGTFTLLALHFLSATLEE
jgi:hypothetical protein